MKRIIALAAILTLSLAGCSSRTVDVNTAGAEPVEGTGSLYRFCDQSTLIYVSIVSAEPDNFEAFFYGGCVWDKQSGKFLPAIGADVEPRTSPTGSDTDETNQQDERDEN